jgi:acyl-CoA synthetase (AMP-forming)/AMP-acid ligase II
LRHSSTIAQLLAAGRDAAPAIEAPGRRPMTHAELRAHVDATVDALNGHGIVRNDRVAIVLPNGPEMASAFVAIAAGATTAPLNPAYREEEFAFYLEDLRAVALVVESGSESPALAAARAIGIRVFEIVVPADAPAGAFTLREMREGSDETGTAASSSPGVDPSDEQRANEGMDGLLTLAAPDDVALVLHTSGTTSRPKIVPLMHANVCASARNVATTLRLRPEDRCLNVMPLFHIHGIVAALLATLGAGGSVFCTPGFDALKFFAWLGEAKPTWFTAVPTMYQAILARAPRNREAVEEARLRFMRSASAALPPQVMAGIEKLFGAPLVEAYAMTEAAHQMTCNPLPPGVRKPGTVGPAAGPEVAVMDEAGNLLAAGAVGEVVIRGPNVTRGYENNPEANADAFTRGWFRTGDQGVMDEHRYLTITGRLKEIINRGGEKISPAEVDAVLMEHPAVQQVVTFAVPHDKLGEEVAAAVVLREGDKASAQELRDFCAQRLADFKVPRQLLVVDEIPKGPTGKMQRIGMAARLGLA